MYSPTTRLLTVLEVLQAQGRVSGPELAQRLEVEVRSVRRYITMLRDMGIPVESEPGRYGTYYLRPGFRLPPLMFTNAEIMPVVLGLLAVRKLGLATSPGVESALAKIERVLPDELRERVRAIQGVLTLNMAGYETASPEMITAFSLAAYQRRQMWIAYQAFMKAPGERVIDVYGLVYHAGFWYAPAYCHLRRDLRIFRLDRVQRQRLLEATFEAPSGFDPLRHLLDSIASQGGAYAVEVLLRTTLDDARQLIPADLGLLDDTGDGVLMRCNVDGLDWIARFLARLPCRFVVVHPPELRAELRRLAQTILELVDAPPP